MVGASIFLPMGNVVGALSESELWVQEWHDFLAFTGLFGAAYLLNYLLTYSITYLLTHSMQLTGLQLVEKFLAF